MSNQLSIDDLKQAAILNCGYCQGRDPRYEKEPYFQRGENMYLHGGKEATSSSVECKSDQLWEYINAIEKSTQQVEDLKKCSECGGEREG